MIQIGGFFLIFDIIAGTALEGAKNCGKKEALKLAKMPQNIFWIKR